MASLRSTLTIAAVGALAAVAAGVGISQATADTAAPTSGSSSSASSGAASANAGGADSLAPGQGPQLDEGTEMDRVSGDRGGRGHRMMDLSALAAALGVDEAKLQTALQKVRTSMRDQHEATPGSAPSPSDRDAREAAFAAALAKELGIDQAKVSAALQSLRTQASADRRTALSSRLDAAVKAGTLTAADKAAVLKAFDAGVLGGPRRG